MSSSSHNKAVVEALTRRKALANVVHSPLEKYPDHARAIGMISIEIGNLEWSLGEMLGSLLHIDPANGAIVYLSPQTAMGRLAILENLRSDGKGMFKKGGRSDRQLGNLLRRARTVIGKRHEQIHQSWGIASRKSAEDAVEELVATRKVPFIASKPMKPVPLAELERLIADIRKLNTDVRDATASNYASWPAYSLTPTLPSQFVGDPDRTPDSPRKGKAPTPQPRQQSSKASPAKRKRPGVRQRRAEKAKNGEN